LVHHERNIDKTLFIAVNIEFVKIFKYSKTLLVQGGQLLIKI
jgi:hypothetical protein